MLARVNSVCLLAYLHCCSCGLTAPCCVVLCLRYGSRDLMLDDSCSTTTCWYISLYHSRYVVRMKKRPTKIYIWEKKAFILKQDEKKRKTPLAGKL